jgi:hypothetical protein
MRSGSAEKTYASGQGGGVGGPVARGGSGVRSAVVRVGVGGGPRDGGGVLCITGVADGEGGANSESSAGEGGANGESCAGEGESGVGDGAGGGDGGRVVRAGEGGVVLRGERARASSSPTSLSSSASHRLLAAFLVRLAGGGEGFDERSGECSGRSDTGRGFSGTACLFSAFGDFGLVNVGGEAGGCSGRGGLGSGYSDLRRRRRRRWRRARGAPMACGVA